MIHLAGADIVLPDRVLTGATVVMDGEEIVGIEEGSAAPATSDRVDLSGSLVVPGFIDVHVHGVVGHDVLDGAGSIARIAAPS